MQGDGGRRVPDRRSARRRPAGRDRPAGHPDALGRPGASPCAAKTASGGPSARTPPPGSSTTTRSTSGERVGDPVLDEDQRGVGVAGGRAATASRTSAAPGRVEVGGRLVEQQQPGAQGERPRRARAVAARRRTARRWAGPGRSGKPTRRSASSTRGQISLGRYAPVLQPERHVVAAAGHHELGLAGPGRRCRRVRGPCAGRARRSRRCPRTRRSPPAAARRARRAGCDLPAPDGPSSSTRSPCAMRRSTPRTAQARRPACRQPNPRSTTSPTSARDPSMIAGRPGQTGGAVAAGGEAVQHTGLGQRPGQGPAADAGDDRGADHGDQRRVRQPVARPGRTRRTRRSTSNMRGAQRRPAAPASSATGSCERAVAQRREDQLRAEALDRGPAAMTIDAPLAAEQRGDDRGDGLACRAAAPGLRMTRPPRTAGTSQTPYRTACAGREEGERRLGRRSRAGPRPRR